MEEGGDNLLTLYACKGDNILSYNCMHLFLCFVFGFLILMMKGEINFNTVCSFSLFF